MKLVPLFQIFDFDSFAPSRGRELKYLWTKTRNRIFWFAPSRGRELKFLAAQHDGGPGAFAPSRGRELKYRAAFHNDRRKTDVRPLAGAGIEIMPR